jgi:hypothetical protein
LSVPQRIKSECWHEGIGHVCAVCGNRYRNECEAHHVLRVQTLRTQASVRGFDFEQVRWDRRNRLPVCAVCHQRHHSRFRPIGRAVLEACAPKVFQFARELGLLHVLEREYPENPATLSGA